MPRIDPPRFELRGSRDHVEVNEQQVGESPPAHELLDQSFRRDYGRLVALLVRRLGVQHLATVEDAVQSALLAALHAWSADLAPRDPTAWLFRAAYNRVIQDLRIDSGRARIEQSIAAQMSEVAVEANEPVSVEEIRDDLLRMLFVCCDDVIPWESRVMLSLKTLCGFSTGEIALRLFTSEANVYKRLARARQRLRRAHVDVGRLPLSALRSRLPAVHAVLYQLFNEGYLSFHADHAIRRELCEEAIRLAATVADHPTCGGPETFALLSLMHLHSARLSARTDAMGGLLLLEEQDRTLWDRTRIFEGMTWLRRSADGDTFSRFHAEAGIAAVHCLAPTFAETRWDEIVDLYATLEASAPSPLHTLNRALAIAEWKGPQAALALVDGLAPPDWLAGSYLWDAALSDLHARAGHAELSSQYRARALNGAPTDAVRCVLRRRLAGTE